jgi:hypothetical protein
MNTTLNRIVAGTLLWIGVAIAGSGLTAGTAQAGPGLAPQTPGWKVCQTQTCWCPGRALPSSHTPITWDMNVCHDWHYAWHDNPAAGDQVIDGPLNCWAIFPKCLY